MDLIILAVAFVIILFGAELFTNGIEWFGRKLELAEGAVGSVLAAVGTALPETMIPLIAIVFVPGSHGSSEVGVGAILGAPFMLATLAMFITALAVFAVRGRHNDELRVNPKVLGADLRWWAVGYAVAIGAAFLPAHSEVPRALAAVGLLVMYGLYVREHFKAEEEAGEPEALPPLRLGRLDRNGTGDGTPPRLRIVSVQVIVALGFIIAGAYVFVGAVQDLAATLGVDRALLALVIAPIATELPEKFNSVLWVRQGKDTLAMGNITGAMVFQSVFPTSIALLFAGDAWAVTGDSWLAFLSAGMAFLATAVIFLPMIRTGKLRARGLLVGGAVYALYLVIVIGGVITGSVGHA